MSPEEIAERYIECWKETFSLYKKHVLLVPFFVIAGVKILFLLLVYFCWHPLVSGFMAPTLESLAGEEFLHFPMHILALPRVFGVINAFVMLALGFVMLAWAVFMIDDAIEGKRYRLVNYAGQVSICIPSILLIGFVFLALAAGVPWLLEKIAARVPLGRLLMLVGPLAIFVSLAVRVLLVYSLIFLKYLRGRAFPALKRSVGFANARLPLTVLVVFTAWMIQKPFEFLGSRSSFLVESSKSEWVAIYLLLGIIVEIFALFFLFVSTTSIAFGKAGRG
ncbi:MAG: hypothetical protein JSW58_04770 [Candidatus Latescibacterota bacterium]|nr:MAG: hypothetical protein JSW58_04770 [Candidatus Latescibacterota bacterium]